MELVAIAGLAFIAYLLILNWDILPDRIPAHFGFEGRPDAYGNKSTLLLLPGAAVLVYLLLTLVGRYPHIFNYPWKITSENAYRQYQLAVTMMTALKTEIIWIFNYITLIEIRVSLGNAEGLGQMFLPIFLIVIFGPIGIYLYISYKER